MAPEKGPIILIPLKNYIECLNLYSPSRTKVARAMISPCWSRTLYWMAWENGVACAPLDFIWQHKTNNEQWTIQSTIDQLFSLLFSLAYDLQWNTVINEIKWNTTIFPFLNFHSYFQSLSLIFIIFYYFICLIVNILSLLTVHTFW